MPSLPYRPAQVVTAGPQAAKVYIKIEPQDDAERSIQDHLKRVVEAPAMQVILPMDLFVEFANAM